MNTCEECDFRFNFPSIPNKCICVKCKNKFVLNLHTLEWEPVEHFDAESRSDEVLINIWFN